MLKRKIFKNPDLWLFLLPSLLGVLVFVLLPFGDVVRRSFMGAMSGKFTGLANYAAVFSNQAFRLAAGNTLRFMGICIPLLLVLSLGVAIVLHRHIAQAQFYKTSFLLPMAIPIASVVAVWRLLFHQNGFLNSFLSNVGVQPIAWMDSQWAFWVLVLSYIWKNLGYNVILWMAGLAGISGDIYEAAQVDGAGRWATFRRITLPCLMPSLYTITVLAILNSFKVFREAYLVAGDYPHTSMYLMQHLFNNWFRDLSMDKLAAAAVIIAVVILALILFLRRFWEED